MSTQTGPVIELREASTPKSNQRGQSRTAWSLYLEKQTPSEPASMAPSMRWPSHRPTYQWTGPPTSSRATSEPASKASSMRWSSHRPTHQWTDSPTSSRATSEPASMTPILNAMISSSPYLSANRPTSCSCVN